MIERRAGLEVLKGAERAWFIAGLVGLHPENFKEAGWNISDDVPLLYDMPSLEQRNLLLYAADLLLESDEEYVPNALVDAAIYGVLQLASYFSEKGVSEREFNEDPELLYYKYLAREAAIQANREGEAGEDGRGFGDVPEFENQNRREWAVLTEVLSDNILETHDFLMYEQFADLASETSGKVKASFGIPGEYFSGVPEISGHEVKRLLKLYRKWKEEDARNYDRFTDLYNIS